MNNSYKIVLLVTIVLCGLILGYYITSDRDEETPILDESNPIVADAGSTPGTPPSSRTTPLDAAGRNTPATPPGSSRIIPPPPQRPGSSLMDSVNAHTRNSHGDNAPATGNEAGPAVPTPPPAVTPDAGSSSANVETGSARTTPITTINQMPPISASNDAGRAAGSTTDTAPRPRTDQPTVDRLPNTGRAALKTPLPTSGRTYTIKSGDTLSSIARDTLGSEGQWHAIAEANPYLDPRKLKVGQVIRLPYPEGTFDNAGKDGSRASSAGNAVGPLEYVVREGDTLSAIARTHYGDPNLWQPIHLANRDKIGSDPANIRPGMKLFIPPSPRIAQ